MWAMHTPYKHFSCSWTLLGFNTRSAFLALSLLTGSYALSAPPLTKQLPPPLLISSSCQTFCDKFLKTVAS